MYIGRRRRGLKARLATYAVSLVLAGMALVAAGLVVAPDTVSDLGDKVRAGAVWVFGDDPPPQEY